MTIGFGIGIDGATHAPRMTALTRGARRGATLAAALLSLCAAQASAATHYAAPNGSAANWPCTTGASPCDLRTAIQGTGAQKPTAGDQVIVQNTGNTYTLNNEPIVAPVAEDIESSGGIVQIDATGMTSGAFLTLGGYGQPSELVHLQVYESGADGTAAVATRGNTTLDRDLIASSASSGDAVEPSATDKLLDTVADATGTSGSGVAAAATSGGVVTLRNVTAYAPDGGVGVRADTSGCSATALTMSLVNVIVDGTRADLDGVDPCAVGGVINFEVDYSSYLPSGSLFTQNVTVAGSHDITQRPTFVNAAAYGFAEKKGSPTIDEGNNDPTDGALDPDGRPRLLGPRPDIGAYEFPAPGAVTQAPTNVTTSGATLNGTVDLEGSDLATKYEFAWGTSPANVNSTVPVPEPSLPAQVTQIPDPQTVHAALSGLSPSTTYYYQVLANNTNGQTFGAVESFTTPAPAAPQAKLTIAFAGSGHGTVNSSPDVGGCDVGCTLTVQTATSYTLTATADDGSKFAGWSGAGCTGTGTCTVDLGADGTVTATFTKTGSPAHPERPTLTAFKLTGTATHKPRLRFTVTHGSGAPSLKTVAITLPTNLKFASHKHGISISVRHTKLTLKHHVLTIALPSGAPALTVKLKRPAIETRHTKHPHLKLTVAVTDTAGTTTRLTEPT